MKTILLLMIRLLAVNDSDDAKYYAVKAHVSQNSTCSELSVIVPNVVSVKCKINSSLDKSVRNQFNDYYVNSLATKSCGFVDNPIVFEFDTYGEAERFRIKLIADAKKDNFNVTSVADFRVFCD